MTYIFITESFWEILAVKIFEKKVKFYLIVYFRYILLHIYILMGDMPYLLHNDYSNVDKFYDTNKTAL